MFKEYRMKTIEELLKIGYEETKFGLVKIYIRDGLTIDNVINYEMKQKLGSVLKLKYTGKQIDKDYEYEDIYGWLWPEECIVKECLFDDLDDLFDVLCEITYH